MYGIIVVLKLFLLAFCYCYRAEQQSKINRHLLREDDEIQRSFEPPPSNDRFHDPPPSYWATVNNDENQNQIRPSYFTPTRMN